MIRVRAKCEGISPLLMNPMTEEALDGADDPSKRKTKAPDTPLAQICEELLYRENGHIGLPAVNLLSCIIGAGVFIKFEGNMRVSTKTTTLVPAFLTIEEFFLPFDDGTTWVVDKRRAKNRRGGALRVIRPRFDRWSFTFTLQIDDTQVNEQLVQRLVEFAGSRVGLCDFRPTCRGPFGCFRVTEWVVIERIEEEEFKWKGAPAETSIGTEAEGAEAAVEV